MPDPLAPGSRVVVTGGHGFVGRHVVRALSVAGYEPVAVAHPSGEADDPPGDTVLADLADPGAAATAVDDAAAVVHLAARAGGIQFQQATALDVFTDNRALTDSVLAAAAAAGVPRVFLASSMVVYRAAAEPLTEDHPLLGPADEPSAYAWSKITDEVVAGWHPDPECVVGRFGNVYGPGAPFDPERSTVVHALIDRAARLDDGDDLVVWGDGTAVRSLVFVEDVARAVVRILEAGVSRTPYNVDSGEPVTIADLAETIATEVNPGVRVRFDPSKPSGPAMRVASIDRLRGLGFEPSVGLPDGIRRTVEWYRDTQT